MLQFTDTKEVAQTLCVELHLTGMMLQNLHTKGSLAGIHVNPLSCRVGYVCKRRCHKVASGDAKRKSGNIVAKPVAVNSIGRSYRKA